MICSDKIVLLAFAATITADVLRIPIARISPGTATRRDPQPRLSKRASFTEFLANNLTEGGYYASVNVGSPGQALNLILDTGSSDAVLIAKDADLCENKTLQLRYRNTCGQTFDPSQSGTYQVVIPDGFFIRYMDGSHASGDYITDKLEIGGATVDALQMGLARKTVTGEGILGIGFSTNEAAKKEYPNLVDQMLNQSLVPTRAYSLYLNDYDSSTGSILFGGLDSEKFLGELVAVPVLPDAGTQSYTSFKVSMTGLSFSFPNGTAYNATLPGGTLEAILDSGTTLTYLPAGIALPVFAAVGAYTYTFPSGAEGPTLVDCALAGSGLEFAFRFGDAATIVVPVDELVIGTFSQGGTPDGVPFAEACIFGIQNSGDASEQAILLTVGFTLLGDTFLRSAYVVYDIDNKKIGLAQANLNSTKSNVKELNAGLSGLPVFTGVARPKGGSGVSNGSFVNDTGISTNAATSIKSAIGTGTLSMSNNSAVVMSIVATGVDPTTSPTMVVTGMAIAGTSTSARSFP